MEVQTLGSHAFVVYINSDEIRDASLDPDGFDEERVRRLLSPLLPDSLPVRIESYPGRDELLLFVRKCAGRPVFFRFDDFESLLASVQNACCDVPSSLYHIDGGYVLAVRPWDAEDGAEAFWEFGERLDVLPEYTEHLAEHGKILISGNAVAVLRQFFDK